MEYNNKQRPVNHQTVKRCVLNPLYYVATSKSVIWNSCKPQLDIYLRTKLPLTIQPRRYICTEVIYYSNWVILFLPELFYMEENFSH